MQFSLRATLSLAFGITSAYKMHPMLLQAAQQMNCTLPGKFYVRNFIGQPNGTVADAPAPSFCTFSYEDPASTVKTFCQFNATSKSITSKGPAPRFACENSNVEFIWQNGLLTLVGRACLSLQKWVIPEGGIKDFRSFSDEEMLTTFRTPLWEVSGSIKISAPCAAGKCTANSTDYVGDFVSLEPVQDTTSHKMTYEMMQLE